MQTEEYIRADLEWLNAVEVPPYPPEKTSDQLLDELNESFKDGEKHFLPYLYEEWRGVARLLKNVILPGRVLFDPTAARNERWFRFTENGWARSHVGEGEILHYIDLAKRLYSKRLQNLLERRGKTPKYKDDDEIIALRWENIENEDDEIIVLYQTILDKVFSQKKHINKIITFCKNEMFFKGKWDEKNGENLLPCANGLFDLEDRTFRRYTPDDYLLRKINVTFDPAERAPLWEKTLSEIFLFDAEVIDWIQRLFGYIITRWPWAGIIVFFSGRAGAKWEKPDCKHAPACSGRLCDRYPGEKTAR